MTVDQLLKILVERCDGSDGIVFFDCDVATRYSICFVERSATTGIVYLHRQELGANETAAAIDGVDIDEATDILVEVVSQSEKFVETKWKEVIHQPGHEKIESYLYAPVSRLLEVSSQIEEFLKIKWKEVIQQADYEKTEAIYIDRFDDDIFKDLWWINGYLMRDGEFRLDIRDALVILGYREDARSKVFEAFEKLGAIRKLTGFRSAETISLTSFVEIINLEAHYLQNKNAVLIQSRFTLERLIPYFRDAFAITETTSPVAETGKGSILNSINSDDGAIWHQYCLGLLDENEEIIFNLFRRLKKETLIDILPSDAPGKPGYIWKWRGKESDAVFKTQDLALISAINYLNDSYQEAVSLDGRLDTISKIKNILLDQQASSDRQLWILTFLLLGFLGIFVGYVISSSLGI